MHTVRSCDGVHFRCGACTFAGSVAEAVAHVVANQFIVRRVA